jgi:long-chain acyl-CoA synthetase
LRPTKDVQSVLDVVRPDYDAARTLWSTKVCNFRVSRDITLTNLVLTNLVLIVHFVQITNAELLIRINNVAAGLMRLARLAPGESNVLLLLNDGLGRYPYLSP